ncbi:ADP-ribose pyrophosphatase YjhB, NUDIX family [Microbacterium sp. cf046]|uniref:NUDIX hydrolase n=1 Tax=Microbacterium sp. cf046 TaxID=1761803 RepID=UPI0008E73151|nr:CoA pyrophosphatase [Microbacterium sp. cf046]SFS03867.1 ADP-ribose pyrophosphatase YjhB, NUDIX family [Microbacterium sp. cf046]
MRADHTTQNARAQLATLAGAVASGSGGPGFEAFAGLPIAANSRAAAVLMLFGVLDGQPSDREAQADAVSRNLDVLLLKRASTLRSNPSQIAFPGGRLDPGDDSPIAAALREAEEETGLDPAGVEVLGALETVPLAFTQHVVVPVLAWWRHPSPVRVVDEAESSDVFRAPVAELLDPANRGVTVIRRDDQEWRGPGFLVRRVDARGEPDGEHLVWGFTGMLLEGLFDRLGWTEPWDRARELPLVLPDLDSSSAR